MLLLVVECQQPVLLLLQGSALLLLVVECQEPVFLVQGSAAAVVIECQQPVLPCRSCCSLLSANNRFCSCCRAALLLLAVDANNRFCICCRAALCCCSLLSANNRFCSCQTTPSMCCSIRFSFVFPSIPNGGIDVISLVLSSKKTLFRNSTISGGAVIGNALLR